MIGFPLSAICSGSPLEMDKQHFLSLANETGYLEFNGREPFKHIQKNTQQLNTKDWYYFLPTLVFAGQPL
jgi:hypothetical protein